jgi:hypothetical protein
MVFDLLSLGVIGDYVAKIYDESKWRPLYIISERVNLQVPAEPLRRAIVLQNPEPGSVRVKQPTQEVSLLGK